MIISSFVSVPTSSPPYFYRPAADNFLCPTGNFPQFASHRFLNWRKPKRDVNRGGKRELNLCMAELAQDVPFAAAIGACVLNSLVSPAIYAGEEEDDGGAAIDSTDARFAVMGIISFIPYFNWLGWVFAWLDTSRPRYLVYAIAYLAPYLRTNLSLSPEESWLPISSILVCIIHIQLEASIRNGDYNSFFFFNEALKLRSFFTGNKSLKICNKSYENCIKDKIHAIAGKEAVDRLPTEHIDGHEGSDEHRY